MKKFIFLSLFIAILLTPVCKVDASSYNYDFFKNPVYSSEGLTHKDTMYFNSMMTETFVDGDYYIGNDNEFVTLADMSISSDKIYILDGASSDNKDTVISVGGKEAKIKKNSAIYILNNDYTILDRVNVFFMTEEVKTKLQNFYKYEKEPAQVSAEEVAASNFYNSAASGATTATRPPYFQLEVGGQQQTVTTFYSADGMFVSEDYIYVADTANARICRIQKEKANVNGVLGYVIDEVYLTPDDEVFVQFGDNASNTDVDSTLFAPAKIIVDGDGRVYTIANGTYQGILEYNEDGEFNRFLGKNLVTKRSWWTFLLTQEQYDKLALNLPSTFTNLTLDSRNLIYATAQPDDSATQAKEMIKLINTSGSDVLKRNGYVTPDGDVNYTKYVKPAVEGPSTFTAIDVNESRIYSAVDSRRGRIFTYDDEGNLLYISGEKGTYSNNINIPEALKYFNVQRGDETVQYVLVLDSGNDGIIIFETTEFGKLVNRATHLYLNNQIEEAEETWLEVVKMNSNYELGYVGIGKSLLRKAGDYASTEDQLRVYKEAMDYFELGHNALYYSDAYKQYRNILLKENFSLMMTGAAIIVVGAVVLTLVKKNYLRNLEASKKGGQQ